MISVRQYKRFTYFYFVIGQSFLTPSKIYVKQLLPLIYSGVIKSARHITSGGLLRNITKLLQGQDLIAELEATAWTIPSVFGWLLTKGSLSDLTILNTFNCGIGLVVIVDKNNTTWKQLPGAVAIGKVHIFLSNRIGEVYAQVGFFCR